MCGFSEPGSFSLACWRVHILLEKAVMRIVDSLSVTNQRDRQEPESRAHRYMAVPAFTAEAQQQLMMISIINKGQYERD